MVAEYFLGLLVALFLTAFRRDAEQFKVAAALFANWAACWALGRIGVGADWRWLFMVDYATGLSLALVSASRAPLVVVGIYVVQCIAHAAMAFASGSASAIYYYLVILSWTAWAQLIFVGGWAGGSMVGLWRGGNHRRCRTPAYRALYAALARKAASR